MRTFELKYPHSFEQGELPETVSAVGFFDGVHQGHQKVIETAVIEARERGMESAVITFHPHPSVVLKGADQVKYLTTLKEKQEIMEQMDVDRLYIIRFNKELSSLSPQQFVDHFIIGLNIRHMVAGFDYSFGHKGQGSMDNLENYTRGFFTHTTVDKVTMDSEKVSSSRIRKLLVSGEMEQANELLGRPFILEGLVIHGDQRGKEIGYPTANLQVDHDSLLPKPGIYAVKVNYKGATHYGMANIGTNPTFTAEREDLSIEVNILDYDNDLYGEMLQVEWYRYIREEERFNGVKELVERIAQDEREIRSFFAANGME
ncbi:bifunctional riboflavin kinase/FAD synthetase [Virgibacillus xinjiangensis]|uniref:Riboflavin biosynthesis protein n=1 Tax=Virgibacillus xinjiangensis TaxID=393090 RepID=A0ABV7CVG1_9BACI